MSQEEKIQRSNEGIKWWQKEDQTGSHDIVSDIWRHTSNKAMRLLLCE